MSDALGCAYLNVGFVPRFANPLLPC
jgi:hypothetical protein